MGNPAVPKIRTASPQNGPLFVTSPVPPTDPLATAGNPTHDIVDLDSKFTHWTVGAECYTAVAGGSDNLAVPTTGTVTVTVETWELPGVFVDPSGSGANVIDFASAPSPIGFSANVKSIRCVCAGGISGNSVTHIRFKAASNES